MSLKFSFVIFKDSTPCIFQNCSKDFQQLNEYLKEQVRIYLRRKHRKMSKYKAYPNRYLYETLGLYKIPTTARWTQTAKACGRR